MIFSLKITLIFCVVEKHGTSQISTPFQDKFIFLTKKLKESRKKKSEALEHYDHDHDHYHYPQLYEHYDVKSISPTGKSDSRSDSPPNYFSNANHTDPQSQSSGIHTSGDYHRNSHHPNLGGTGTRPSSSRGCATPVTGKRVPRTGTATGACSLQVQTGPNGDVRKVFTLWQNYYPEGQWGWIVVLSVLIVQTINHGTLLTFSNFILSVHSNFGVTDPTLIGEYHDTFHFHYIPLLYDGHILITRIVFILKPNPLILKLEGLHWATQTFLYHVAYT